MNQDNLLSTGRLIYERIQRWQNSTSLFAKLGWVCLGYLLSAVIAAVCVALYSMLFPAPPGEDGMRAFGALLLFLAVFAIVSIVPTSAQLYILRPYPQFWRASSVAAIVISFISMVASVATVIAPASTPASLGFLLVLTAPLFALGFGLSGLFAPDRNSRILLFAAAFTEGTAFALWLISVLLGRH